MKIAIIIIIIIHSLVLLLLCIKQDRPWCYTNQATGKKKQKNYDTLGERRGMDKNNG